MSRRRSVTASIGDVGGHEVLVGSRSWLREHGIDAAVPEQLDGAAKVVVAVDGKATGVALIGDRLRADADQLVPSCGKRASGTLRSSPATRPQSPNASVKPSASTASTPSRAPTRSSRSSARYKRAPTCVRS